MTVFQIIFLTACSWVFVSCIYLTLARCYATGVFGSIGFCLMALCAFHYLIEWFMNEGSVPPPGRLMMVGIALLLAQHVSRVYRKAKADRRKQTDSRGMGALRREDRGRFRLVNRHP